MGITIIKNRQFRRKFLQNWLTPKGKTHSNNPRLAISQSYPETCQYLSLLDNINTPLNSCSWNPTLCISRWWHWKGDISQRFRGKTHYCGWSAQTLRVAHPVNYLPGFLGKNITDCPPIKIFIFTSLLHNGMCANDLFQYLSITESSKFTRSKVKVLI